MKRKFLCLFCFICALTVHGESDRLNQLLKGYLENDLELKKSTLSANGKSLLLSSAIINNTFNLKLSTGNISVTTSMDDRTRITMDPAVSIEIPQAMGTSIDFSLPYTIEDDRSSVKGGSLSASVGIISDQSKKRNVTLLEAERAYLEAKRMVEDKALTAEKEFYESLKKLYNYAISIHSKKSDLYDDEVTLRVLETQGYSKTSAKYRQAYLKVQSDRRDIQEKQRIFERETSIFAKKCGFEFGRTSRSRDENQEKGVRDESDYDPVKAGERAYEAAIAFLPSEIPSVKPERIFNHDKNAYSKTETAIWNKKIGELKRQADYDMSLNATAEYKFNSVQSNYDDVGGKLTFGWKGVSASAGAYVPTGNNLFENDNGIKNENPYFQFSLAFDPREWRLSKIEKQQKQIDSELEDISVEDARNDYEETVLSKVSTYHDIRWAGASYAEEYDMYTKLESDMKNWLKQGIVTENDYMDAKNNKEKARINLMINAVDLMIYNDEVKLLFHEDK